MAKPLLQRIAEWFAPPLPPKARVSPTLSGTRMYAGAKGTRFTGGFGTSTVTSADAELELSLTSLRGRSRQLMRDASYAKRAGLLIVNNVIGSGVGLQAQVKTTRGGMKDTVNETIEDAWCEWSRAENCHTGGALHFSDLERAVMLEVFTAGEAFVRMHPKAFGRSKVPLALELIEPERLADGKSFPAPLAVGNEVRMGVELDSFQRAVAFWIRSRHPGDTHIQPGQVDKFVRVPAEDILHVRLVTRWPQTRGEPWLHCVVRKLNDMEEYSGSELLAARLGANIFGTLETPEADALAAEPQPDGTKQIEAEPGVLYETSPGVKLNMFAPNRPNQALDPFMRYMLREVAAGTGVSYESLSRDYSQSNYSSSRLALLDDRDLWRVLQAWWVRGFRVRLHERWMQQAVLAKAIPGMTIEAYALNTEACCAVRWKLRGWSWVDPTKEVAAYKEARKAGFISTTQIIEQTGNGADIEDVVEQIEREQELFAEHGITVDTNTPPATASASSPAPAPVPVPEGGEVEGETTSGDATSKARVVVMAKVA